jgi:hypothetical protein
MSAVCRAALDATTIALALDEDGDVSSHPREEQAHRNVSERETDEKRDSKREEEGSECGEGRHLLPTNSKVPAEAATL